MIKWQKDPLKTIKHLKQGLQNKAMRIALNKAAGPVKADFVQAVPVETGTLKKSIRIRQQVYKNKQVWATIVGPASSFKRSVKVGNKVKGQKQQREIRRPSKYYPLLQFGTKHIAALMITQHVFGKCKNQFTVTFCEALKQQIAQLLAHN